MEKEKIIFSLENKKLENNFRNLKIFDEKSINLSSNDYIGIASDEELRDKFIKEYSKDIWMSSSSRLITGNYKVLRELEEELNRIYGKKSLVMNSGFSANKTIISTFYNKDSLIITDKLNHASIYDGIISSGSKIMRYRHLDLNHLEEILKKYKNLYKDILVVSETVYSMDGDTVNLEKLIELKRKYEFDLMLDEAHSYGVFGYGMAYNLKVVKNIDFLVIPLGKGGGSIGAYIICDEVYRDYLINFGKELIYTTSLPPVNNLWNLYVLKNMNNFDEKINKLKDLKEFTLKRVKELNLLTDSDSQIIGLIIGDNRKTDIISKNLRAKGYVVYGIKSPTVAKGTERIRIGLNPNISKKEIENFLMGFKNECDSFL